MSFVGTVAVDAGSVCAALGIDPEKLLPASKQERLKILQAGMDISTKQYCAYILAVGFAAGLLFSVAYVALTILFGLNILYVFIALPLVPLGMMFARYHFAFLVRARARDVDLNLLDALRHLLSELRSGENIAHAALNVSEEDYGAVSDLLKEALIYISEGASVESAFREVSARTPSESFRNFTASLSYSLSTGNSLVQVLEKNVRELEMSQRIAVSIYTNECSKLSTLAVVLTGVLPGLLIFALAEGGFVFGFRLPVESFMLIYLLAFPLAKYVMQAKLASISPGV